MNSKRISVRFLQKYHFKLGQKIARHMDSFQLHKIDKISVCNEFFSSSSNYFHPIALQAIILKCPLDAIKLYFPAFEFSILRNKHIQMYEF